MVMPNIVAFIAGGIIIAFFIPTESKLVAGTRGRVLIILFCNKRVSYYIKINCIYDRIAIRTL